eukprot:3938841-Rhodomonas_salina.1
MRKVWAECALGAHHGWDCGNKRIQIFLRKGGHSPVLIDLFPDIGLGLRASRYLAEGEIVGVYWGRAQKTISKRAQKKRHCYVVDYKDCVKLTAEKEGSLMRYVNSSCQPNVRLEEWDVGFRKIIVYVSTRGVWEGEDLTASYNDSDWKGKCCCRKHGCCGSIGAPPL